MYKVSYSPGAGGGGELTSSSVGKLFKRGGKKGRKRGKREERRKGQKMVGKKRKWEAKKDDFVVKILGSLSNWAWEGFQARWNNLHT